MLTGADLCFLGHQRGYIQIQSGDRTLAVFCIGTTVKKYACCEKICKKMLSKRDFTLHFKVLLHFINIVLACHFQIWSGYRNIFSCMCWEKNYDEKILCAGKISKKCKGGGILTCGCTAALL